ncbi:MAG: UPF0158 family protein [Candidatus Marinimicrobia bacterium]|nr:UPF0158 family protein [Candidatus Neomarinimicrobiota bacterium]
MGKYSEVLIDNIIDALDNTNYEIRYYFNKKTKETKYFTDHDDEDILKNEKKLDRNNWISIKGMKSYQKYNLMKDFVSKQDGKLKELLVIALDGKGAFRRFKDVLYEFPEIQKKWYEFKREWMKQKAIDFLEDL